MDGYPAVTNLTTENWVVRNEGTISVIAEQFIIIIFLCVLILPYPSVEFLRQMAIFAKPADTQ